MKNPSDISYFVVPFNGLRRFSSCWLCALVWPVFIYNNQHTGNTDNLPMLLMFKGKCNNFSGVSSHLATEKRIDVLKEANRACHPPRSESNKGYCCHFKGTE